MSQTPNPTAMNCPRDKSPLECVERGKTQIDRCKVCSGIWCDADELASLAGTPSDLPDGGAELYGLSASCPRCGQCLTRRFYSHHQSVVVDFCSDCHGVWLDHNELQEIVLLAHGLVRLD